MNKNPLVAGNSHHCRPTERLRQKETGDLNTMNRANPDNSVARTMQTGMLDFQDVKTNDCLLIFTRNSFYTFFVTNAAEMRGSLGGGFYLDDRCEAVLLGSVSDESDSLSGRASLQVDRKARFLVDTGDQTRQMMTSAITRFVCLRKYSVADVEDEALLDGQGVS